MQTLKEYIKSNYKSQFDFAEDIGLSKQRVGQLIKNGCIVVNGVVFERQPKNTVINGIAYKEREFKL